MNTATGWFGVVIGALGCVAAYALCRKASGGEAEVSSGRRIYLSSGLTLLITLVFWAISMMSRKPFSPGQTLGYGFLIGGVIGAFAGLLNSRLACNGSTSIRCGMLASHSTMFFALFGASLTYSIFHSNPEWALTGFAIGTALAGVLAFYMHDRNSLSGIYSEVWALFGISIVAAIILAEQHFDRTALRFWWSLPILLAATVLVASFLGSEVGLSGQTGVSRGRSLSISSLVAAVITVLLSIIYAWRIVDDWSLLGVVCTGVIAAAIVAWISAISNKAETPAYSVDAASATILILIAFAVAAFKLWSGLGIALGLIAAWSVVIPSLAFSSVGEAGDGQRLSATLRDVLSLGLVILLFRLFVEAYRSDLGNADLQIHYTFIGALLGALLPLVLASSLERCRDRQAGSDLNGSHLVTGIALLGLISAASPILLFVVWGIKAVLGFVFGLTVTGVLILFIRLSPRDEGSPLRGPSVGLLSIGAQLTAIEFIRPLVDLDLTRAVRAGVLGVAVLIAVIWFVYGGISAANRLGRGGR